jgi:hypothetical protein
LGQQKNKKEKKSKTKKKKEMCGLIKEKNPK